MIDKNHTGRRIIKESLDKATRHNQAMRVMLVGENTAYKERAHRKMIERPWYLRSMKVDE